MHARVAARWRCQHPSRLTAVFSPRPRGARSISSTSAKLSAQETTAAKPAFSGVDFTGIETLLQSRPQNADTEVAKALLENLKATGIGFRTDRSVPGPSRRKQPSKPKGSPKQLPPKIASEVHPNAVPVKWGHVHSSMVSGLRDVKKPRRRLIPTLAHGLDSVLQQKGVQRLRDPETNEYHFTQYLQSIPKVEDFAFDRLPPFTTSSRDETLQEFAKRHSCRFTGSTSSLTGILTQIYLLLSEEKAIRTESLSKEFEEAPKFFTPGQRLPVSVVLTLQDGVYATDSDKERDGGNENVILLPLGTLLEKFLTMPPEEFKKFTKDYTGNDHPKLEDTHRYSKHGKFLMRSQLDCINDSLSGTGVFDLKTRAITQIRHDVYNYTNYLNCRLEALTGRRDSFEEEYYDMIRAAFLEYSFQVRIGDMAGILVAYHNTAEIFGFQYISLKEMDACLFGREGAGDGVFYRCIYLMEMLYNNIVQCFPDESVKVTFEKSGKVLRAWVEPVRTAGQPDSKIAQLELRLNNFLKGEPVRGFQAVYQQERHWSLDYCLSRSTMTQEEIIKSRARAYSRQESISTGFQEGIVEPDA